MHSGSMIWKVTSSLFIIIILIITGTGCLEINQWSGKGDLLIDLSIENVTVTMDRNITNRFILTFTNPNDHALGILRINYWISIFDENGSGIKNDLPIPSTLGPTNRDIIVIEPGKNISFFGHNVWDWFIKSGKIYYAIAKYNPSADAMVTKPYWRGELTSEKLYFSVE
jgi:hypothetical protein